MASGKGPSQAGIGTPRRAPRLAAAGNPTSGATNSTTYVTAVGSPAKNFVREVVALTAVNRDNVSHTFIWSYYDGTTDREFYVSEVVNAGLSMVPYELPIYLDATTQLVKLKLLESATTQCDFTAMYKDHS